MAKTHPPYLPEFRAEAVEFVHTSGKSIPESAHARGVGTGIAYLGEARRD